MPRAYRPDHPTGGFALSHRLRKQLFFGLAIVGTFVFLSSRTSLLGASPDSFSQDQFEHAFSEEGNPTDITTKLITSAAGFGFFETLYLRSGTLYLLSPPGAPPYDPELGGGGGFVDLRGVQLRKRTELFSTGLRDIPGNVAERDATERDITVLPWEERHRLQLDERPPLRVEGTSILINDAGELFLDHYYHLWCELLLAAWKSISLSSDGKEDRQGHTSVDFPRRLMFSHADDDQWRDMNTGINGYLMKLIWPSVAFEYRLDWEERQVTGQTYVFDKIVLVDRSGGSRGDSVGGPKKWYFKPNGDVLDIPGSQYWWQPIRQRLLSTLPKEVRPTRPVITYISRQGHGRSLKDSDHIKLVKALEALAARKDYILEIPTMEDLSKDEQFALAGRTTVMLGVHGNGLSHQLWVEHSPWSTVIEIFIDQGFNYDYALPASALGHRHYAIWNDKIIDTVAEQPKVNFPDQFHSTQIRANGETIAQLIEKRLEGWMP